MHCHRTEQADEHIKCWLFIDTTCFSHDSGATNSDVKRTQKSYLSKSKIKYCLQITHTNINWVKVLKYLLFFFLSTAENLDLF